LNQLFLSEVSIIGGSWYAIVFSKAYMTEWSMAIHQLPRRKSGIVCRNTLAFHAFSMEALSEN